MSPFWQRLMNHLKTSTPKADNADQGGRILIVGLGNPGKKYVANRHNIGFMAVNRFADNHQLALNRTQNRSRVGSGRVADRAIVLAKPQTFMNRSGEAVAGLARFYKIAPVHILVVYDELDLPFGAIRLREKGGAGGHNGMRSVIQHIGEGFPRLRLGIGRPPGRMDPAAYVLQDFRGKELEVVSQILDAAAAAMESFIRDGIDLAMTWHNKK